MRDARVQPVNQPPKMRRARSDFLLTLCSLSACLGVLYLAVVQPEQPRSGEPASSAPAAASDFDDKTRELENKVARLSQDLTRATKQLDNALARLEATSAATAKNAAITEAMTQVSAPEPGIAGPNGSRNPRFRELLSPSGEPIAFDLRFQGLYGRRLVFRDADNRPTAFDVEEVHPGVLGHLGIDLDEARDAGRRADEKRQARAAAAARRQEEKAAALARAAARNREAEAAAADAIKSTAPQTTYVTINQPPPTQPFYSTPVYQYWTCPTSLVRVPRRSHVPTPPSFHFNLGPLSANVAPTAAWVGSTSARFPYNEGFRFNPTGPYTTIPR